MSDFVLSSTSGRSGNQRVSSSTLVEKRSVMCRKCYEMPLLDFDDFRSGERYVPRNDLLDIHINPYTGLCVVIFDDSLNQPPSLIV